MVFNYTKVNYYTLRSMIQNNVGFPFNFLLSRPHARYTCEYAIKMKRGTDTVATYQRRGQFVVGDDVNICAHVGHYRYYSKVVVKKPQNVSVARCVYISGYHGGMGSRFIDYRGYKPHDGEYGNGSLFSFLVAYTEGENTAPMVINVSGAIGDYRTMYALTEEAGFHYSSAPFYNAVWGFKSGISFEIDNPDADTINCRKMINYNTLRGTTLHRDPITRNFTVKVSGKGHWGDEATYAGVAAARRGHDQYRRPTIIG